MFEIGRLCVKIAGRDAGKKCLIVEIVDENHVMIDGETRRRKCSVKHLELLDQVVKIKKGASHDEIVKEMEKLGLKGRKTKAKVKTERPKKVRKRKEKVIEEKPKKEVKKKTVKKEEKKSEEKK
ncbi:50S ribosomal protein L14e [Candidatus Woesearchaeota archaeon]|nr:50S ribosomal protein L14e [Candidatus Woesearchaeota archaeon]